MEKLNEKKLGLFLGNCVNATNGEWISLPMEESKLKEILNTLSKKYGELIIADYSKEVDYLESLYINEYSNVLELNYILNQPKEFIVLYIHGDEDLDFANEMWRRGEYLYVPNVKNTEELGEAIAKLDLVKGITQNLMDMGYIDYSQIGTDFECNGLVIYKGLGAIGQIAERDYLKWKSKPINSKSKSLAQFLLENGVSKEDIDSHESDLYVSYSPFVEDLITKYEECHGFKLSKESFIDNISKTKWFNIPFGYMPEHFNSR